MFKTQIEADLLGRRMTQIEREQFPFALANALNDTAFEDVRPGWKDEMLQVFDRPKRITLNAVLVTKANKKRTPIEAEIYIRDEASKGTPPARYLEHQVEGGTRPRKPFENLLIRAGVMVPGEFAVPGKGAHLDAYGNIKGGVINAILSDIRASREAAQYSSAESKRKRERRRTKRGGVYFYSRGERRQLPRGIYERIRTAFGTGVRSVLFFVRGVHYRPRYDALDITRELFYRNFPKRFRQSMRRALQTARPRGRRR